MTTTQLHLIHQANSLRVTFGPSPDAQTACAGLQETVSEQLELVGVVQCRNIRAAMQVQKMLHDRYQAYQDGAWYVLFLIK